MANFPERLRSLRREFHMSQREIGLRAGLSASSISMYEQGSRTPDIESLEALADYFNVDVDYLLGRTDVRNACAIQDDVDDELQLPDPEPVIPIATQRLALYDKIACAEPIEADFVVRAEDNSMINDRIREGDLIFIRRQDFVDNGEIAAISKGGCIMLRRCFYYPDLKMTVFRPAHPDYNDFIYTDDAPSDVRIIGKAVALQTRL